MPADEDPLGLEEGEQAWSMPLGIDGEVGLPLRYVDDETEAQASLASLSGALTNALAGERVVSRVGAIHVKDNSWANRYQRHLDRDGEDQPEQETSWWRVAVVTWLIVVLGAALVGFISELDRDLETAALASVRFAAFPFIGGGLLLFLVWLMVRGKDFTPDLEDIERMRRKAGRHAYDAALEIVVILPSGSRIERAEELADALIDAYRWYEVVGNKRTFKSGRLRSVKAIEPAAIWKFSSKPTVLGAEEISGLWHLPDAELLARSIDLAVPMIAGGEGALVGVTTGSDAGRPVHFPDRQFERHTFFLASSGMGKSTLMQHIVEHKLRLKAEGRDDTAIVVIDPHADLIEAILPLVPEEVIGMTKLIDLGNAERLPGINLLDAHIFGHRERVVDALLGMFRAQWEYWGPQMERYMRLGLTTLHAANGRRAPDEQHTLLDLRRLLTDAGHRRWVLGDVSETYIRTLWDAYEREGSSARDERLVPVTTRLDAYSLSRPALAVLGQSRSTVDIPSILEGGGVLLVNTASGTLGGQVGTLVGGAIVSLVESTVRGYERMAPQDRPRTLLVVDEAQAIVGIDYERMLSELRKYGLTMMIATQNLTRLKEISDSMQATVMSNNGTLVVFRISAEDARQMVGELGRDRVSEADIRALDDHEAYVSRDLDGKRQDSFRMKLELPQSGDPAIAARIRAAAKSYTTRIEDL